MEKMTLDFEDKVAVLKFNHPQVLNAVGQDMLKDFSAAIAEVKNSKSGARCLLLTGVGRGFCCGADLSDEDQLRPGGAGEILRRHYHPLLCALRELEMCIVTAVNGAAAGVGMSFAMVGDIVCASKQAFFLQPFSGIGLIPDGGATFILPRMVGMGRALELSLLGERLPAEKAYQWGLVNRLYDNNEALMEGAMQIAIQLSNGPMSLSLTRKAYQHSWHNTYEEQLDLEAQLQTVASNSSDFKEGVAAFLVKRKAQFRAS